MQLKNVLKWKPVSNFANKHIKGKEEEFRLVLEKCRDIKNNVDPSVFGIDYEIKDEGVHSSVVYPSHILLDNENDSLLPKIKTIRLYADDYYLWTGYLSKEPFKPLRKTEIDLFRDILEEEVSKVTPIGDNPIHLQFLFSFIPSYENFRQFNYLDSYEKYTNKGGEPLNEAADKILDEHLRMQILLLVPREGVSLSHKLADLVQNALSRFDYYNGIRLKRPILYRSDFTNYNDCIISTKTYNSSISISEVDNMFDLGLELEKPLVAHQTNTENVSSSPQNNLISLLPYGNQGDYLEPDHEPEQAVNQIADALKRVGIIKQARLYDSDVIFGARLITIQCSIPKGKNITDIQKKIKDIQAVLAINSLGIEQGTEPDTVRFTIPNGRPSIVTLRELMELREYEEFISNESNKLPFVIGVDEVNKPIYLSLSKLVHLMIAGTTGSGKSVFISSLSLSLIMNHTPDELKMIMIDPKRIELNKFERFPHVDAVIKDMEKAEHLLKELVGEMEARYKLMEDNNAKNIIIYNKKRDIEEKMPYIVCIIDEYADLKDMFPNVEEHIARLGQKARAAGIHLVIATQRPDVNVISGRVKAVIPNAISFNLKNSSNYRTVFGTTIPYSSLLGNGDGVMNIEGHPKEFQRFQSTIVAPDEGTESELYETLVAHYTKEDFLSSRLEIKNIPVAEEDNKLNELKTVIAQTGETKISPLRTYLEVKTETVSKLMNQLVEEGWLIKHNSKAKGYELIATEEMLKDYK